MNNLYIGLTEFSKTPIETTVIKGNVEQALIFQRIVFGRSAVSVQQYGTKNPEIVPLIDLNNLKFICEHDGDKTVFECSHANKYLFSGYQDMTTNNISIATEEKIVGGEIEIKDLCVFPSFEDHAVCENCNGEGYYDSADMPESKIVECECTNVIFTNE
jgi:hypothetical protein